jgi:hypothetical protein
VPRLNFTSSVAAGATYQPLSGWQYEYVPLGGIATFVFDAGAVDVVVTITSGSDTLMERSPVDAGGTTGEIPSSFDQDPVIDEVAAGDRLKLLFENTSAGAIVINGYADYKMA